MKTTLMTTIMSHAPGILSLIISTTKEKVLESHHLVIMSLLLMNAALTTPSRTCSRRRLPMRAATTTFTIPQRVVSTMNLSAVIVSLKLDIKTLYVVIIILAIIRLLSSLRWPKDCMSGQTATTTMKTSLVHEGASIIPNEEQLLFQRRAMRSTLTQELIYIAKPKTEVYHTRECQFKIRFGASMSYKRICAEC
jgi:hypothetical protein